MTVLQNCLYHSQHKYCFPVDCVCKVDSLDFKVVQIFVILMSSFLLNSFLCTEKYSRLTVFFAELLSSKHVLNIDYITQPLVTI